MKHEGLELITLPKLESRHIEDLLAREDGNRAKAAEILGFD